MVIVLDIRIGWVQVVLTDPLTDPAFVSYSIASAFTAVVKSLVSDILTPILGLLPFINRNLDEKFAVLRRGPTYCHPPHDDYNTKHCGYNTLGQARDDGAVVLAYGMLLARYASAKNTTDYFQVHSSTRLSTSSSLVLLSI